MPVQVYSFYIFDRHTECIYSKLWISPPRPPSLTGRSAADLPPSSTSTGGLTSPPGPHDPRRGGGVVAATNENVARAEQQQARRTRRAGDDAKLIFGTVFSLRNMTRKLGGDDDAFISFRTGQYKMHYYETLTNLRFAMLTEPGAPSMRNVLHQIYINLWVEYVVKNPLSPVEHKGGEGVRNEMFELGLDRFIRGLM
ncbi:Longin-like domain-containing protein [Pseudomassariella vexata]|uniref:Trafficking protein particle complex subunit n=1 Tax=Pseudomassariella vexata TaxID=1141098 RepID=A0A1Y2EEV3_9PEZI|nr:Longin-like domain-containing protein [Pseudomassariella vexata]ORY69937.1 Longin-like domain-containing protein [Pseudomassariella vexata]